MDTGFGFFTMVVVAFAIILFHNGKDAYNAKCGFPKDQSLQIGLAWQEGLYGSVPCQREGKAS